MLIRQIEDDQLAQYAFLIGCQQTGEALVLDPERDVDRDLALAKHEGLRVTAVAETHIHADFLSGARKLVARLRTCACIQPRAAKAGNMNGHSRTVRM